MTKHTRLMLAHNAAALLGLLAGWVVELYRERPHPCSDPECIDSAPDDHGMTRCQANHWLAEHHPTYTRGETHA